jgi:hypothetical protein
MGNNVPCNIVGVGRINIKMFDDIFRTLTEVRQVPKLKKNLIFWGFLDSRGYKFIAQGGAMKVSKGILVVMKAKNIGNLYKLEGSTQVHEIEMASEEANEPSHLWNH